MFSTKLSSLLHRLPKQTIPNVQQLWGYVAIAFNKVENDRLKFVGPDRLCAEWILKNGGAVSFVQAPGRFLKDYNALPTESTRVQVKEIDATDSSIMKIGLEHLKSCKHIDRIILRRCKHLECDGLESLPYVKDTLKQLEVSSCYNINDEGLRVLKDMKQLKSLLLLDLISVNDLGKVVKELESHLIGCVIQTKE